MKSYELQVLDKGNWLTDSVYDDRDLAVDQARQLDGNNRFGGIRVIEEIFTEGSSKSVCKTVFRDSGNRQEFEDRIAKSKNEIRGRAPKPGGHKQVTRIPRKKITAAGGVEFSRALLGDRNSPDNRPGRRRRVPVSAGAGLNPPLNQFPQAAC